MTLADLVHRWQRRRADIEAFDALGPAGQAELARDVGLSSDVLHRLIARDRSSELPGLLAAVELDVDGLQRTNPAILRDMAVVCSGCTGVGRCHAARDGSASLTCRQYCPNAKTIDALRLDEIAR